MTKSPFYLCMIRRIFLFFVILSSLVACSDDDSFTTSPSARLTFSTDSVKMDTIFSNVGSRTYDFWVYNNASDGIRLQSVRLRQGNQKGFRVNVNGYYLDNSVGSVMTGLELPKGDSIRVFVELTTPLNGQDEPKVVTDDLVFRLESGVEQSVVLQGCSWDAIFMHDVVVSSDSLIESTKPLVIYGGISVDSAVTLTIRNTTLYFHDGKGIEVGGHLLTDSVVMRGDRLDRMFTYLPYDRVSGQWGKKGGIVIRKSSTGNVLRHTEIRNAGLYGVTCDSAAVVDGVLRLDMEDCIVHNTAGDCLYADNANIRLRNCLFSNAKGDCVCISGGKADISRCTMAQFYAFAGGRGFALSFTNMKTPLLELKCDSIVMTGYDDNEFIGLNTDTTKLFNYQFSRSLLRMPKIETKDSVRFESIIWESPQDSVQGKQHFRLVDSDSLRYDFHIIDSISPARGLGWR